MRRPAIAFIVLALTSLDAFGQAPKFPFEAIVDAPDAYVRSGPGERFYPTGKLRKGSLVNVVRKDFGGWFMINPPEGSFSWVRAEYVDMTAAGQGTINADNVVIRVGSSFGEVRDVEQRRISTGDSVEILGQSTLDANGAQVKYYKIRPPKGEYRWILGQAVVAKNAAVRQNSDTDPYSVPSQVRAGGDLPASPGSPADPGPMVADTNDPPTGAVIDTSNGIAERPVTRFQDEQSVRRTVAPPEKLTADRDRLIELDGVFREMIRQDTSKWDFIGLEQGYRQLHANAASPALQSQVELRYPALEKYKRIKQEYDDFVMLTRETEERDAQLLSMQSQMTGMAVDTPPVPPSNTPAPNPAPTGNPDNSVPSGQQPHPKFVGAGIVQRIGFVPPGRPQFALVAPDGRLLAYLQGDQGVDLNQYIGRPMGLEGRRWHRPELRGDFILVRTLTPVRLRTPQRQP